MEKKPKYGWYVKNLIVSFTFIGLLGLLILICGIVIKEFLRIILIIIGLVLICVFLWPGIGMILMHLFLLKKVSIVDKMEALIEFENPKVLDVGCGTGRTAIRIAKALKKGGHLYGIDIYDKMAISGNALDTIQKNATIEQVSDKITFQFGSAIDIPFNDNEFDMVNISSVLHEIHDPNDKDKALDELYRVLKPNGYIYISEWNRNSWQCIALFGICSLVFKNKRFWNNLIKNHGFKDIKYENLGGFGLYKAKK